MDSFSIKDPNLIKIFHNTFPNSVEYLLFNLYPNNLEINARDETKSLFCQLILNKEAFDEYTINIPHIIPIIHKEFNNVIKSSTLRFLVSPRMSMEFEDANVNIIISDKNKTSELNIKKQIRATKIIKSEGLGKPNMPKFDDSSFCFIDNPEYLKSISNSLPDIAFVEVSIENFSIIFKGKGELENESELSIAGRIKGSGQSKIFTQHFKHASNVCDLKLVKQSKISISKEGIVKFSHTLENGLINYYLSKAID